MSCAYAIIIKSFLSFVIIAGLVITNDKVFIQIKHFFRCNESAAAICKEMGDNCGTLKYMDLAADGYAESGSSDSSAMVLDKAARCFEDIDPEKAIKVFIYHFLCC